MQFERRHTFIPVKHEPNMSLDFPFTPLPNRSRSQQLNHINQIFSTPDNMMLASSAIEDYAELMRQAMDGEIIESQADVKSNFPPAVVEETVENPESNSNTVLAAVKPEPNVEPEVQPNIMPVEEEEEESEDTEPLDDKICPDCRGPKTKAAQRCRYVLQSLSLINLIFQQLLQRIPPQECEKQEEVAVPHSVYTLYDLCNPITSFVSVH